MVFVIVHDRRDMISGVPSTLSDTNCCCPAKLMAINHAKQHTQRQFNYERFVLRNYISTYLIICEMNVRNILKSQYVLRRNHDVYQLRVRAGQKIAEEKVSVTGIVGGQNEAENGHPCRCHHCGSLNGDRDAQWTLLSRQDCCKQDTAVLSGGGWTHADGTAHGLMGPFAGPAPAAAASRTIVAAS